MSELPQRISECLGRRGEYVPRGSGHVANCVDADRCEPADTTRCRGCEDDFYNGRNPMGVKECWSRSTAKVVTRWRTGTWTLPTQPGAFTEVEVFTCFRQKGEHFSDRIPSFAVDPVRIRRSKDVL